MRVGWVTTLREAAPAARQGEREPPQAAHGAGLRALHPPRLARGHVVVPQKVQGAVRHEVREVRREPLPGRLRLPAHGAERERDVAEVPGRGHVPFLDEPESLAAIHAWLDLCREATRG